jgi:hypothetical protein
MTDILDIALLHRPGEKLGRGAFITERFSVDFLVNGRSLYGLLKQGDFSGAFLSHKDRLPRRRQVNEEQRRLFTAFGDMPLRVAILVCPECGDLGCGGITFDLARTGDKVLWSNFGYENSFDESRNDFEKYKDVGPFEFEIARYIEVIERAAKGKL